MRVHMFNQDGDNPGPAMYLNLDLCVALLEEPIEIASEQWTVATMVVLGSTSDGETLSYRVCETPAAMLGIEDVDA